MLSEDQLKEVNSWLQGYLANTYAFEEVFDHIITAIEHQMLGGKSFAEAFQKSKAEFTQQDFESIKSTEKRIKLKRKIMISSPILIVTLALSIFTVANIQTHNPWKLPLAQDGLVKMSSGFGYRVHPILKEKRLHKGMDFVAPKGTPVRPALDGVVTRVVYNNTGYGNHINVTHNDSVVTRYAQLHEINVKEGEKVTQDQIIGTVGSSGTSTAPHLHFEVMVNGKHVNPAKLDSVFVY